MYRKLTKERSWQWIRFVAPIGFLQSCPLDLSSAQRDIANDQGTGTPQRSEPAAPASASTDLKNAVLSASTLEHPGNVG
ncbi:MAG: hypothetical protein ACP5QR_08970 [Rhizomicrobium sp.]